MSSILITLPLVLPIIVSLGYDPLWWGVICLIQVEVALIHPPLGIIVFLLHAIAPKIPMGTIYRGVVPFLIADFAGSDPPDPVAGDRSVAAANSDPLKRRSRRGARQPDDGAAAHVRSPQSATGRRARVQLLRSVPK